MAGQQGGEKGQGHHVLGMVQGPHTYFHLILSLYSFLKRSAFLAPFCRHESKGPERLCGFSKVLRVERVRAGSNLTLYLPPTLILSPLGPCPLHGMGNISRPFTPGPREDASFPFNREVLGPHGLKFLLSSPSRDCLCSHSPQRSIRELVNGWHSFQEAKWVLGANSQIQAGIGGSLCLSFLSG